MKINLTKICVFICFLTMLLSLFSIAICADDETYTPVEWTIDQDVRYIYGGEKRYDRFYVNYAFYSDSTFKFYFANSATLNGKSCRVYGEAADPHIVSVEKGDGYSYIFVDREGKIIINDFLERKNCLYRLESFADHTTAPLDEAFVTSLEKEYNSKSGWIKTVSVVSLGEAEILEITVRDKTENLAYQHGAIYIMEDGSYYYVCFEKLDNSYFDADGYFSYRKGEVKALQLKETAIQNVDRVIETMQRKTKTIVYENDVIAGTVDIYGNPIFPPIFDELFNQTTYVVMFWILLFIFGVLLPTPLLILGLVCAKKAKYWYALSGFAALWILSSVAISLILFL